MSTEMEVVTGTDAARGIVPLRSSTQYLGHNLVDAAVFAKLMFQSGVGGECRGPSEILARIMTGLELGLTPMVAIRELHVINGKVGMSARVMHTLARRAGAKLVFVEQSEKKCVVKITPPKETTEHTFEWTLDDAVKAGITRNGTWTKYPRQMLMSRALSMAVNYACPEVLSGGMYEIEELREIEADDAAAGTTRERVDEKMREFDAVFAGRTKDAAAVKAIEGKPAKKSAEVDDAPAPASDTMPTSDVVDVAATKPTAVDPWDEDELPPPTEPQPQPEPKSRRGAKPKPEPVKAKALESGTQAMAAAFKDAACKAGVYMLGGNVDIEADVASACGIDVRAYPITTLIDMVNAVEILNALRANAKDEATNG